MLRFFVLLVCVCIVIIQDSYASISQNADKGCGESTDQSVIVPIGTIFNINQTIFGKIEPILAIDISVSRELTEAGNYCVSYGLRGYTLTTASVLSYSMTLPRLEKNKDIYDIYTGWCDAEMCFGGRGQLMDGKIGGNSASKEVVEWKCSRGDEPCTFRLKIYLSRQVNVSRIVFYGYQTSRDIRPPQIHISPPDISISSDVAMETSDESDGTYKMNISLGIITDVLDIDMVVEEGKRLVLSEVEVWSEGVNIGTSSIGYTNSSRNTATAIMNASSFNAIQNCHDTILYTIFLLIVVIQFLLLLSLFTCCIYTTTKYEGMKKQCILLTDPYQTRHPYMNVKGDCNPLYESIKFDGNLATLPEERNAIPQKGVFTSKQSSLQEPLLTQSPEHTGGTTFLNSGSVAWSNSYVMKDNALYGDGKFPEEKGPTLYVDEFSEYDRIKHK